MQPTVTIQQEGRGGTIYFEHAGGRIPLYWEFGAGDCIAIIFLPSDTAWEQAFGSAAARKADFINLIAAEIIRQKAPGCQARLQDSWLEIYR